MVNHMILLHFCTSMAPSHPLPYSILEQSCGREIILPILQMSKLRLGEVKDHAKGFTARKQSSQHVFCQHVLLSRIFPYASGSQLRVLVPQGTFSKVWKHVLVGITGVGRCYCYLVGRMGRGQRCSSISFLKKFLRVCSLKVEIGKHGRA